MRVVIQRVARANVSIDSNTKSEIGKGLLVLLGVGMDDTKEDADWLVKKIADMRIFGDEKGIMNLSVKDVKGEVMVVSQFTLMASTKKGNRPSWFHAATHDIAIPLYEYFAEQMTAAIGKATKTGEFGADMKISLMNDGPVTIIMDSKNKE